jgi:5-methylcytosine-specific restriction endonuclease McrA
MGKMTPSQAKNAIRRALAGIVDPHPSQSQVHTIWEYFGHACAYCGRELKRSDRDGHIDHLVSTGVGGSNSLGNCVLACGPCNGDEKRDEHWETFLRKKASDPELFAARHNRIQEWAASHKAPVVNEALAAALVKESDKLCAAFDSALGRLRSLKSELHHPA